jgi:hypothetical protein
MNRKSLCIYKRKDADVEVMSLYIGWPSANQEPEPAVWGGTSRKASLL